jgi:hypothetical protein
MARGAPRRVFLLSPADCSGKRARLLARPDADHDLARRLREEGSVPLGEAFSFISSLYFRGKLAYARAFARPPRDLEGVYVITPADGLVVPGAAVGLEVLRRWAGVPVEPGEERYRLPLQRDLEALAPRWESAEIVLLGSIATGKYTDLLSPLLGDRLLFPPDFVGRGDMSRGGLMLRAVREGRELRYVRCEGAARHGPRVARLSPQPRQR